MPEKGYKTSDGNLTNWKNNIRKVLLSKIAFQAIFRYPSRDRIGFTAKLANGFIRHVHHTDAVKQIFVLPEQGESVLVHLHDDLRLYLVTAGSMTFRCPVYT